MYLRILLVLIVLNTLASEISTAAQPKTYDLVIYGGTSGGVAAAVQAKRMGKSVILISPYQRIGGLSSNGLGQTDIGNKAAIGGISREFYQRVAKHYSKPSAWKWQEREEYRSGGQSVTKKGEETMWTFTPEVALNIFKEMAKEAKVEIVYDEWLDRKNGVKKDGTRIVAITMESGKVFQGRMFIDATYEGDLLAAAGVSHTVGREANSKYQETLNGVATKYAIHHQLKPGIDPYIKKGDPSSGLLPGIDPKGPGKEGGGDHRVQAYCFRMCLTDHPGNRIPFHKPKGYDRLRYELLFRNFEAGANVPPWSNSLMPNRKTDTNNNRGFSTDFIGQNYDYPEADYTTRKKIVENHLIYQQGLMWTLANHPRVPEKMRKLYARWGVCKDEFVETNGWPEQIYVREARRMISDYVMTQHNCQGRKIAEDVVGMAAYTMDSHNVQRYVDAKGQVRNEGDVQVGGFPPYPISYQSIVPKKVECTNLLVPVCLSASHIAFGSIRMEPVFMVLGQSAATAACLAIDDDVKVQDVDYEKLRKRLLEDEQVLVWTGKRSIGIDPKKLSGIIVDDEQAIRKGFGSTSTAASPYVGTAYRHDGNVTDTIQSAKYVPKLSKAGVYEVRVSYTTHGNRATNVPVSVYDGKQMKTIMINQRKTPPIDKMFISLGRYTFEKGETAWVGITNEKADGYVVIDAVQFLPVN